MIRHIVTWKFKEGFTEAENRANGQKIKAALEALKGLIPGIIELEVRVDALPSSNRDIVLNSLFESEEALAAYQVHPEHLKTSSLVGAAARDRACIDYCE